MNTPQTPQGVADLINRTHMTFEQAAQIVADIKHELSTAVSFSVMENDTLKMTVDLGRLEHLREA